MCVVQGRGFYPMELAKSIVRVSTGHDGVLHSTHYFATLNAPITDVLFLLETYIDLMPKQRSIVLPDDVTYE
jgi:hypothetical protein